MLTEPEALKLIIDFIAERLKQIPAENLASDATKLACSLIVAGTKMMYEMSTPETAVTAVQNLSTETVKALLKRGNT